MSKRAARKPRAAAILPPLWAQATLRPGSVVLQIPPGLPNLPHTAGLLLDGALIGSAPVVEGTDTVLALPDWALGRALQVVAIPEGRALLEAPIELGGQRGVEWLEWTVAGGRIAGSFRLGGDAAPAAAESLPVYLAAAGASAGPCFATPDGESVWRFETDLPRLAARGCPVSLAARVGSLDIDETVQLSHEDFGVLGHLDVSDALHVQGWAVDLEDKRRRVQVAVTINGRTIWTGAAEQMRDDVKAHDLSDGRSGFRIPFPKDLPRGVPLTVAVTLAGTRTHLVDSPYTLPAPPPFLGYFDALEGPFAGGWCVNMHAPDKPPTIEAVCDGEVIGHGIADLFRGDVEKAGMPTARCGFRFLLERPLASLFDRDIHLRIAGTDQVLGGSPRQISQNSNIVRFLTRNAALPPRTLNRLVRRMTHQTNGTTLSIIMPVFNTRREWLIEALNSVLAQWSANWELICVDDGSTAPHVREILDAASRHDTRIRIMRSPGNLGIARATNFGLRAARGAYVAFMDHDDTIEPDAVHKLLMAARETRADLVYSDEAITTDDIGSIIEVRARPAFSYDYYLSHPYFVHMIAVRTEIAQRLGGWDESLPISADVDFVLRVIEQAAVVAHVPSVLYRWRTHGDSAGHSKQAEVTETMKGVLTRHLRRRNQAATVSEGLRYNEYRIDWPDDGGEVLVVIPTKNRVDLLKTAIDSIEKTSRDENVRIVVIDHDSTDRRTVKYLKEIGARHTVMPYSGVFNYALMNNLAVKTHGGAAKYFLFLNNDVEAIQDGWIPRMRSLAARPDVGAVGCLLLYGDDRVQHAGVLVGFSGAADHAMKFQDAYLGKGARHPGYNCSLTAVRDYSAVTAACLMTPAAAFRAVDGFDEGFVVGFNDTDLCLRIGEAGYKVLYDGYTVLYHHESATRTMSNEVDHPEDDARLRTRWRRYFVKGDPFYSPMLAPRGTDHTLRQDTGCKGRMGVRGVSLDAVSGKRVKPPERMRLRKGKVRAES